MEYWESPRTKGKVESPKSKEGRAPGSGALPFAVGCRIASCQVHAVPWVVADERSVCGLVQFPIEDGARRLDML